MICTKYESYGTCSFGLEDFLILHFDNLFFDPMTYLSNQFEWFEQIW